MKIKYITPEKNQIDISQIQKIVEENARLREKISVLENDLRNKIQTLEAQLSQLQADIQAVKKVLKL
ncbi:MAG: hypothetical protein QXN77_09545 [Candidatus Caldarchaeum sp.]